LPLHLPTEADHKVREGSEASRFHLFWPDVELKVVGVEEVAVHMKPAHLKPEKVVGDRPILSDELDRWRGIDLSTITSEYVGLGDEEPGIGGLPIIGAGPLDVDVSETPVRLELRRGLAPGHLDTLPRQGIRVDRRRCRSLCIHPK
jgi:hypothetical protein